MHNQQTLELTDDSPVPQGVDVSVVVIGRNEGPRLARCLASVAEATWGQLRHEVIYVDSASGDDSRETAARAGAQVLLLDDPSPCAAKGRNLGWRRAQGRFVLFLDGDTELEPGFVQEALDAMLKPELCAVWGHRRESRPEQSLFTRVLDLDWRYPPGPSLYFGGDVLVRREALAQVDGFDPALKAGEEPELCARLRASGWHILHIDAPMTRHDLAITSWSGWARRSYRSGVAYAEVAERMRRLGDPMWQREARRDLVHGALYVAAPLLLITAFLWAPALAWTALALAAALLLRTAHRAAWRTPHRLLRLQYAVHVHLQKIPALAGQLAWRWARLRQREIGLVDYKRAEAAPGLQAASGGSVLKALASQVLAPLAWLRRTGMDRLLRLWHHARLREALGGQLPASTVVLGAVAVEGTRRIHIGHGALIYPGVLLETQGEGEIHIGDGAVLSRGVHVVAFDRVEIGAGSMLGEYTSVRDANHRLGTDSLRDSGHTHAPVVLEPHTWLGRGVAVLQGVRIGRGSCVAANAVLTQSIPAMTIAAGIPARPIRQIQATGQG